jgi:hypothetical protein
MANQMTKEEAICDLAAAAILIVPCILWFGFMISCMWGWFVVPLGVPQVGVVHASGIGLLVRRLGGFPRPEKHERAVAVQISSAMTTGFILLSGLILHWVM